MGETLAHLQEAFDSIIPQWSEASGAKRHSRLILPLETQFV